MTALLETRDLEVGHGKGRKRRSVLSGINIAVAPGEMVCLLGPNGVGKSTLMRTLARAQPALSGSVLIDGKDAALMSQADLARKVGVVLTERIAIGAMPASRLVELGRYPHVNWAGQLSAADRTIVRDAIFAVGAAQLAHRDINELSDGERQRFMIARALAQNPAILLLDEPAAYLDVSGRVEMIAMLRHLAREKNIAVILSSHDLDLSLRTADTIWLIDGRGRFQRGAPEDLLADGSLTSVFSGPNVEFSVAERSFKIKTHPRGTALLKGVDERSGLGQSVLEREGYNLVSASENPDLAVWVHKGGWTARRGKIEAQGSTFAELALFSRQQLETRA